MLERFGRDGNLSPRIRRLGWFICVTLLGAFVLGCATTENPMVYRQERFESDTRHSRGYGVPAAQACEAARRALLSNGYLVQRSSGEWVDAKKQFQPTVDTHVEIEFHVVCVSEGLERSTAFVNAVQNQFALKKVSNSASLGVGPVGSVSLPFGSSSDSLVKTGSETIPSADFYDRFFALIEHYLVDDGDVGGATEASAVRRATDPAPYDEGAQTVPANR